MRAREFINEAHPRQQLSLYNPSGTTYRQQPMPHLTPDPVDAAMPLTKLTKDQRLDTEFQQRLDTDIDQARLRKALERAMSGLDERSRQILLLRAEGMTLEEIGERFGIGMNRVRQIEAQALRKLRHPSRSNALQQFLYAPGDPRYGSMQPDSRVDTVTEKKDACYHKVRSRYRVWPSAYASGALVQCRKRGAANWGKKS